MIKSSSTRPTEAGQASCNQWQTAKNAVVKAKVEFLSLLNARKELVESSGKGPATESNEFLEKFQTAFDPPPSFLENYIANFS